MSDSMTLDQSDWERAGKAAIVWSAPVVLMYLSSVLGVLQVEGHKFVVSDLIPSSFTIGGAVVYVLSQVQGIILRFVADGKK